MIFSRTSLTVRLPHVYFRLVLLRIACPALVLIGVTCAALAEPGPALVRIAGSGWIGDGPTKVADALGLFNGQRDAASPETVRVEYYPTGKQAFDALLAGSAEFALAASPPVARAVLGHRHAPDEMRSDVVILASVALSNYTHYVVARRSHGVTSAADLAGKRLGLEFGTAAHYGWEQFADHHRIASERVHLVDLPYHEQAEALVAGEVDAVLAWNPTASDLKERLAADGVVITMRPIDTINWLLVSQRAYVEAHERLTARIVGAYVAAVRRIGEDPEAMRALHSRIRGIPISQLEAFEAGVFWSVAVDWSILTNMDAAFDWWRRHDSRFAHVRKPSPTRYLVARHLLAVAPDHVQLPSYLYAADAPVGAR